MWLVQGFDNLTTSAKKYISSNYKFRPATSAPHLITPPASAVFIWGWPFRLRVATFAPRFTILKIGRASCRERV